MIKKVFLASLVSIAMSGCLSWGPASEEEPLGPCMPVYWPGCDDNPDPLLVLEKLNLHQFTNETWNETKRNSLTLRNADAGMIYWIEGGFGFPVEYHVVDLHKNQSYLFMPQSWLGQYGGPFGGSFLAKGRVASDFIPIEFDGDERIVREDLMQVMVWDVETNSTHTIHMGLEGQFRMEQHGGFDGEWVSIWRSRVDGVSEELWALNVDTEERVLLAERRPREIHQWLPSSAEVTEGKAYVSWLWRESMEGFASYWRLEEVDLASGDRRIVWEGEEDEGLRYIRVGNGWVIMEKSTPQGLRQLVLHPDGSWRPLIERGFIDAMALAIGGDWAFSSGIAVHLPTGEWHTVTTYPRSWFRVQDSATDGEFAIVRASLDAHSREIDAAYPGPISNLYWTKILSTDED